MEGIFFKLKILLIRHDSLTNYTYIAPIIIIISVGIV